jgi:polyhydroxybutyrate depolymerase
LIGALLFIGAALLIALGLLWRRRNLARWYKINVNGVERRYLLVPSQSGATHKPLLLCFHGGRAQVELLARRSGILELGDRHGCTVVFPEAKDGWIDLRPERGGSARDLDFVDTLLGFLVRNKQIDASRVFALGISNGGQFVFRLACQRPHYFAGFATALANLPVAALSWKSGPPVPMAMVFGKRDRVMPWEGGRLSRRPGLRPGGEVLSVPATIDFWVTRNGALPPPQLRHLISAGRPIDVEDYSAAPDGAPVRCVVVGNWGHRWPRWGQDLSAGSDTFSAADSIMEFFAGLRLSGRKAPAFVMSSEGNTNA